MGGGRGGAHQCRNHHSHPTHAPSQLAPLTTHPQAPSRPPPLHPKLGAPTTLASGDASDTIGRPVDNGQLGILDPDCRAIGLHLYDGLLKIIPVDSQSGLLGSEMFNVRLEELNVIDMCFLAGCGVPTVAVLYEDAKHARHIKTYAVAMRSKVRARAVLRGGVKCHKSNPQG